MRGLILAGVILCQPIGGRPLAVFGDARPVGPLAAVRDIPTARDQLDGGRPFMVVDEKTDFRELARNGGLVLSYRAGDFLFREGDTATCMYIVLKGSVEMSTRDRVYATIPEGRPFGMLSLIDKQPRANSARAKEDCELALIDERAFRVMVEETPGFVWYVIHEFAARLRATHVLLEG